MRLLIAIISSREFPLSPLGLIHVRQTITVYASISDIISQSCDLHCRVSEIREVEKGIEMDMKCDVYSCTEGKVLWSGVTTLLSRNQTTRTRTEQAKRNGERYSQPFSGEREGASLVVAYLYWRLYQSSKLGIGQVLLIPSLRFQIPIPL